MSDTALLPNQFDFDSLLNEQQTAEFLSFSKRTLQAWRQRGGGPKYVKVSSRGVRYRIKDLIKWTEERLKSSTSEASLL